MISKQINSLIINQKKKNSKWFYIQTKSNYKQKLKLKKFMIGYKSIEVKLNKLNSILKIGGSSTGFYRKVCDYSHITLF